MYFIKNEKFDHIRQESTFKNVLKKRQVDIDY